MFKRIDHTEIITTRLEETVRFYTEVLGFTVRRRDRIERGPLGGAMNLAYLDLGGTMVELISHEGAAVEPKPKGMWQGYHGLALEVDDMQKALDYLKSRGVETVWGPYVRENDYARAEIRDPNGFHIELRQWFA
jgi:catechol 2,3-dioxygenase-like lactoylglutathione lyase family enzyme